MEHTPKFQDLVELFEKSCEAFGPRELFGTKTGGAWVWTSYAEVKRLVDDFRGGLASLGIGKGDLVAIIADNRVEWAVAAYATWGLGAAFVPMYESQLEKDWEFITRDCACKALIVSKDAIHAKVKDWSGGKIPGLQSIIHLGGAATDPLSYRSLLARGAASPVPSLRPAPTDTACFIYTSGTTGSPKGVILSHGNVANNVAAVHEVFPMSDSDRSLSFLPWAHSFGYTVELNTMLSMGASMALCEAVEKIIENLAEVKPTLLISVPRIFNRIYAGVQKQMSERPAIIRRLFQSGLAAAAKRREGKALSLKETVVLAAADKLVFSKVRGRFGGRLKYAFSGGAALSKEVAEFIDGLGITVYEGYGLSETSPIATANYPGSRKIGSVGKPIPGVRIVIDKSVTGDPVNGEIIVYGHNVMKGYHNRPEENAAVFTPDGGFRTGDMGYTDAEGFLFITGRIKEQYKLENGKYVVPSPLEEYLKLSPFVANVMIFGANRPYNVAVVVPEMDALSRWAKSQSITDDAAALLTNERVRTLFKNELEKQSAEFKGYEKVQKFVLVPEDFTLANDMLTPSLKLKRRNVIARWQKEIDALYG